MKIQDFADMEKFESIMSDWAVATGLATVGLQLELMESIFPNVTTLQISV